MKNWPVPDSVKQVRAFIALCSYYRRFIKNFAQIARPLHKLLEKQDKKGTNFNWDRGCQDSFENLKTALIAAPILSNPAQSEAFILDTDASDFGIGAVLSQIQDGTEKVIAYFSRSLSRSERNYCVTRKELLAVVESVKHFHQYLYGVHFTVRSDHGALRWLLNFRNPEGQVARWLEVLGTYDFEIVHRPGRIHGNADGLSWRPCQNCNKCTKLEEKESAGLADQGLPTRGLVCGRTTAVGDAMGANWVQSATVGEIRDAQHQDSAVRLVLTWKRIGVRPGWQDVSLCDGRYFRSSS